VFISVVYSPAADRCRSLPSTDHQYQFAKLQLELLEDFRVRLLQVRKEMLDSEGSPVTAHMCSILNTVSYIESMLQQWNNLPVCLLASSWSHAQFANNLEILVSFSKELLSYTLQFFVVESSGKKYVMFLKIYPS